VKDVAVSDDQVSFRYDETRFDMALQDGADLWDNLQNILSHIFLPAQSASIAAFDSLTSVP
jgi:hypothetical protein